MNDSKVDRAEYLYDTYYRPATQRLYAILPKESTETNVEYGVRAARTAFDSLDVSEIMDGICGHGKAFIRAFSCVQDRQYMENSGLARLLNVFLLIMPYESMKYFQIEHRGQPLPATLKECFQVAAHDSVSMTCWEAIILPESTLSKAPFNEKDLAEAIANQN